MEERCENCRFARESKFAPAWRECRRRSPVHSDKANRWPIVQPEDWCGEFEPKPAPKPEGMSGEDARRLVQSFRPARDEWNQRPDGSWIDF